LETWFSNQSGSAIFNLRYALIVATNHLCNIPILHGLVHATFRAPILFLISWAYSALDLYGAFLFLWRYLQGEHCRVLCCGFDDNSGLMLQGLAEGLQC
jgi:hypothetical protein